MTFIEDHSNEIGMAIRDPADDDEGGSRVVPSQEVENVLRTGSHVRRTVFLAPRRDGVRRERDLKPVFDVEGKAERFRQIADSLIARSDALEAPRHE